MDHLTTEFHPSKSERAVRPLLGAVAVLASAATLGLLVAGPAVLAGADNASVLVRMAPPAATAVAIIPGSINVVGKREHVAGADQVYPKHVAYMAP